MFPSKLSPISMALGFDHQYKIVFACQNSESSKTFTKIVYYVEAPSYSQEIAIKIALEFLKKDFRKEIYSIFPGAEPIVVDIENLTVSDLTKEF